MGWFFGKSAKEKTADIHAEAVRGNALAQAQLGECYRTGNGIPKDAEESVRWFRKAAEQNLSVAQYGLALSYLYGNGVPKDSAEAVKWLHLSAEQWNGMALLLLGLCYHKGEGAPRDTIIACRFFRLAALSDHSVGDGTAARKAMEILNTLEETLSKEQKNELETQTNDWRKKHWKTLEIMLANRPLNM